MVYRLRRQLQDASLVYVDIYSAKYSLFKDAAKLGKFFVMLYIDFSNGSLNLKTSKLGLNSYGKIFIFLSLTIKKGETKFCEVLEFSNSHHFSILQIMPWIFILKSG